MIELRWTTPQGTTTKPPTLQWRSRVADPWGRLTLWDEWQDVPTVVLPKRPPPQPWNGIHHRDCWCQACDKAANLIPAHMSVCPECGDKRCPRAEHHSNECSKTPNAEVSGLSTRPPC